MNSKQKAVLAAIFKDPVSGTIPWSDIEGLLVAAGCERKQKKQRTGGSRVKFVKDGMIASFHRPHPQKEAKKYQVEDARAYLTRLGIEP
jgi:hypothetical protein